MKEKITNVLKTRNSVVFKTVKKGQKSFRITQQLLQSLSKKLSPLKQFPYLIIKLPANKNEDYILTCHIKKEKK